MEILDWFENLFVYVCNQSVSLVGMVADEQVSPVGSAPDIQELPSELIAMRSSAFFTNLDSSTTPTPTWIGSP